MNQKIENLDGATLKKVFKQLKRVTGHFSKLIVRDPLDFLDFEVNLTVNSKLIAYEIN